MSVTTTADEKIEKVKESLQEAYRNLLQFLDNETWGHDQYNDSFIEKMHEVAIEILKAKNKIG